MLSCHLSSMAKPSIAGNFIHTATTMPKDYTASPRFFLGCSVQNCGISFELYILKFCLVCWFPCHLGGSIFFIGLEKF